MKHSNISIFVPHAGCPCQCSFCNQKTISGTQHQPQPKEVHEICRKALDEVPDRHNTEIAFFGGSFTAIEKNYMLSLLEAACMYLGENGFKGIRISTRPDCIDKEILNILLYHGVTSIELGAQSLENKVLTVNDRGHTAEDVYRASELILEYGFELGLQMMVGLFKSTAADELNTMNRIIKIHPHTVRIYPIVVLEHTKLAALYKSGDYKLMPFDNVVELCAQMLTEFENQEIKVIKCGLHASEFVEKDMIAGYYHPAFRELCESRLYLNKMLALFTENSNNKIISELNCKSKNITFAVNPSCISKAIGHGKANILHLKKIGINVKIVGDEKILKHQCKIILL